MSDRFQYTTPQLLDFGTRGAEITPTNGADLDADCKAVVVTSVSGGTTLEVLPFGNANGDWVTFEGVSVGYTPPWRVRRVGENTTCTVASVLW